MDIGIISCVGSRALALITPLSSLLRIKNYQTKDIEIFLLYTSYTKQIAEDCQKWFEKEFRGIKITLKAFEKKQDFIEFLCKNKETIYFNVNPGMNWQVAYMSLYLPEKTICLSSDTENLYTWNLMEDIKNCQSYELSDDIDLESYNRFSSHIKINEKDEIKNTLSENITELRLIKKSFRIEFINSDIPQGLQKEINNRLIWAKIYKGHLYLMFNLQSEWRNQEEFKKEQARIKDYFRLITVVFDPINYTVTVVSNMKPIIKRAEIEGVDFIDTSKNNWQSEITEWIKNEREVVPKKVIPKNLGHLPFKVSSKLKEPVLFVCVGDNIDTTLKAIHSHHSQKGINSVCIFYDKDSPRISHFAEQIQLQLIGTIPSQLIPTDHKGEGIIEKITNFESENVFNITPGTKMQTIALTISARKKGAIQKVYSINKDRIEAIVEEKKNFKVEPSKVEKIIACQIPPEKGTTDLCLNDELCKIILERLVNKPKLIPSGDILQLRYKQGKRLEYFCEKIDEDKNEIKVISTGKVYSTGKVFLEKPGIWWEAVVAWAIKTRLNVSIHWQVKWNWVGKSTTNKDVFYAELDIVFPYKEHIGVISCKTGQGELSLEENAFIVGSEAEKRLGRFALSFIAIPYEGKSLKTIGKVKVLTPKTLIDGNRLKNSIEEFINSLRKTSHYNKRIPAKGCF